MDGNEFALAGRSSKILGSGSVPLFPPEFLVSSVRTVTTGIVMNRIRRSPCCRDQHLSLLGRCRRPDASACSVAIGH